MNTPRISYAHLITTVNPRHVASLVRFFEHGAKSERENGYGVEIEHLPVHNGSDEAVNYYEPNGIETLLDRLRPYYDADEEHWENGRLVGLGRKGIGISLEPGGQLECSIGVLHRPEELVGEYGTFRKQINPILDDLGIRLINYGYQPKTSYADVPLNPKSRYAAMTEYLGRVGKFGPCMMRCSASTQVSIDYHNEYDAIEKLRIGTAIGPIMAWFFRNTPYFEGQTNPYPLLRQLMWDTQDPQRTGIIPGLYDSRFGWEDYAVDVLSTPLMFADLTHTPEASSLPDPQKHRVAFRDNAGEIYPDRELNAYEINHVLSTHFNDVRLKNFIELRHWDSLPIDRAERLTEIVGSLFYDRANRERLESYFGGINEFDVIETKTDLQAHGAHSTPYGQPLAFWQEFLGLEGLLADEPGDPKHPDVFQA
ncbi:glutamate-cysteine ligase family protein [Bifidobacterium sp.]|jgi:glutamate--cysteine ligase|uniref:glutamate-cysteine ligase family protein n=1 Tax=Bifidobacterium sp. TaxID=41200 RepID=UPI0025B9B552|nr:glutamate-cysteine ligase family protein [Bifidobacterium sp.]MCH4208789.1 glutamate-cysteine ligase family protein [Bifidobacterium sp.]MCI1224747.1 glutamate-cysteine ligase family protein [Bifidobacterium sp.]